MGCESYFEIGCCWSTTIIAVLGILMCLCHIRNPLQYTIKMFLFCLTCLTLAAILVPVGLIRPFKAENHQILANIVPYVAKYVLSIHVEVRGIEHTKSDKPFVLLLNHQSSLDAYIMMHIWPYPCVTIMKSELKYVFPFGTTSWLFGSIFIDRYNKQNAQNSMKVAADELIKRNVKITMFPEGTRNRDGHLLPFKKGAFNLAVNAQVPLVPATVTNLDNFYSKKKNLFTSGRVIVTVQPPVPTEGLTLEDVPELCQTVRDKMVEVYERTTAELNQSEREKSD